MFFSRTGQPQLTPIMRNDVAMRIATREQMLLLAPHLGLPDFTTNGILDEQTTKAAAAIRLLQKMEEGLATPEQAYRKLKTALIKCGMEKIAIEAMGA